MIEIIESGNSFALRFPYNEVFVLRAKGMPKRRWDKKNSLWVFPPTLANWEYIEKWFPEAKWCNEAKAAQREAGERKNKREQVLERKAFDVDVELDHIPFKLPPMKHQKMALFLGRDMQSFAYLMDQGTGKTKVLLDDAAHNWRNNKISALLVITPNSVKTNWADPDGGDDEISKHMPPDVPYIKACWVNNSTAQQRKVFDEFMTQLTDESKLKILVVNVEGMQGPRITKVLNHYVSVNRCMIAVDESTRIKNRAAKRTKIAIKLRQQCPVARIMTGTPIIKSPLNAFAQFKFLDEDIMGYSSYYSFQNHFAHMGGFNDYQVMFYRNLDELAGKIASSSYRIMKEECLDLPSKTYTTRHMSMSAKQAQAYKDMKVDMIVDLERYCEEHGQVTANIVLTQLLRLQQITSGVLPIIDSEGSTLSVAPIGLENVKVNETMGIIEECDHKVIVWCRFIHEILAVKARCDKAKIGAVTFYGATSDSERTINKRKFQDPNSNVKVFIGQVRTGGLGLTLTEGRTVIYLSNSFSTEDRVQSEDRSHRIGQNLSVEYIDLICKDTVDERIVDVLKNNKRISDEVLGDGWKDWI